MAMASKTAAPAAKAAISLAPSSFVMGGGLLDDADVEVMDAAFLLWDYDGKVTPAVPALGLTLRELEGGNHKAKEGTESGFADHDQYYSAGDAAHFVPNADGTGLVPVSDKTSIVNSTNAAVLLQSMTNCGLPESVLARGNIKDLVGARFHVNRVEQERKNRGGNTRFTGDPNKKQEILVVTKLISLPGEQKTATATATKTAPPSKAAPTKTTATKAAPPSTANGAPPASAFDANDPLHTKTQGWLLEALMEAEGSTLPRKSISPKIFAKAQENKDPDGAKAMKLAFGEEWLRGGEDAGAGWTYDGSKVSIAE